MRNHKRFIRTLARHAILIAGCLVVAFPLYLAFVVATHSLQDLSSPPIPLLPGKHFLNTWHSLNSGVISNISSITRLLLNTLIVALSISFGKIIISILSAYAIVYFDFRYKKIAFWVIFITLMLPVEVRILPTYEVVAQLGMINTYAGLSLPLIASATATFFFRQFFLTVPNELLEAAKLDKAGFWRFFFDILLPVSKTNIAALFVILFVYGWNQYLWPLIIASDARYYTITMAIQRLVVVSDTIPEWPEMMLLSLLAIIPPVIVVLAMQKFFVQGLIQTEK